MKSQVDRHALECVPATIKLNRISTQVLKDATSKFMKDGKTCKGKWKTLLKTFHNFFDYDDGTCKNTKY